MKNLKTNGGTKMNDSFNRDRNFIDSFAQQQLGKNASPKQREDAANNAAHLYRSGLDTTNAARIGAELAREGRRIT
jgi:hypothetical protein